MQRAKIIISGRVQKAGYRDYIDEVAFDLDLSGYVKNIPDGTVEVVCEGDKRSIELLAKKIKIRQYPINVKTLEIQYAKATGEFNDFEIIREDDLTTATYERMDAAVRYMREMNTNLGNKIDNTANKQDQMIDKQDQMIDKQDQMIDKQDQTIHAINDFRTETKESFQTLRSDYGRISKHIETINDNM